MTASLTGTDTPEGGPTPGATHVGLLTQIMTTTLDEDYRTAADARASQPNRPKASNRLTALVVVLAFGAMIGVSAIRTWQQRPAVAAERAQLVAQAHLRQHHLDVLHTQLSHLEREVAALQQDTSTKRTAQQRIETALTQVAAQSGFGAVTGPGIQITADNAPGAGSGSSEGVILDTDLQALANALWQAGAEAIAINGQRLTSLTAIRYAGRAITVDYRSLTPPYVIDAIGDPSTLPARLQETPGGQAWLALQSNFGITVDTQTATNLVLPADDQTAPTQARPVVPR